MKPLSQHELKISALKLSSQGQVTLSKEARQQQGISAGETVLEISLPGMIILLPQSQVVTDLMLKAHSGLSKLGLTVEQPKDQVAQRRRSARDGLGE